MDGGGPNPEGGGVKPAVGGPGIEGGGTPPAPGEAMGVGVPPAVLKKGTDRGAAAAGG